MSFQAGTGYGRVVKAVLTTSQLTAGTTLKTTMEIGLWDESKYASRTNFEWPGETPPQEPKGLPPITQPEELIGGKYLPVGTIVTVQAILYHSSAYQCIRASADVPDSSGAPQAQTGFLYTTNNGTDQVKLYQPLQPEPGPEPSEPETQPSEPETQPTEPEPQPPDPGPGPQPPAPPGSQPGDVQIEVHAGQTVVVEVKSTTNALEGGSSPPEAEKNREKLKERIETARKLIEDLRLTLKSHPKQFIQDEVDGQEIELDEIAKTALNTNRTDLQNEYAKRLDAIIANLNTLQAKLN